MTYFLFPGNFSIVKYVVINLFLGYSREIYRTWSAAHLNPILNNEVSTEL
jgi:hypothetical protein